MIEKNVWGLKDLRHWEGDSIKRCNIHSEKKFVLAKEIKSRKKFQVCVGWMYDGKVLTIGAIILSK